MTKRQFDSVTKQNWGGANLMASDERAHYRAARKINDGRLDTIGRRRAGEYRDRGQRRPGIARWYRDHGKTLLG